MRTIVLLAALVTLAPTAASAQTEGLGLVNGLMIAGTLGGVALDLTFAAADIAYGARSEWLPTGWAIAQIFVAAANFAGGIGLFDFALNERDYRDWAIPGAIFLGYSALSLSHAVLSLVLRTEPPVAVALAPTPGGASLSAAFRF